MKAFFQLPISPVHPVEPTGASKLLPGISEMLRGVPVQTFQCAGIAPQENSASDRQFAINTASHSPRAGDDALESSRPSQPSNDTTTPYVFGLDSNDDFARATASPIPQSLVSCQPSLPQARGWFDPSTKFAKALLTAIKSSSRDELFALFFERSSNRPIYGEDHGNGRGRVDSAQTADDQSEDAHTIAERQRRTRHLYIARESDNRTMNLPYNLAKYWMFDDDEFEKKNNRSSRASPKLGKDQQLCASVLSLDLASIVVLSEHEGRIQTEERCRTLEADARRLQQKIAALEAENSRFRRSRDAPCAKARHSKAIKGTKRPADDCHESAEKESHRSNSHLRVMIEPRQRLRLPPSPCPSIDIHHHERDMDEDPYEEGYVLI